MDERVNYGYQSGSKLITVDTIISANILNSNFEYELLQHIRRKYERRCCGNFYINKVLGIHNRSEPQVIREDVSLSQMKMNIELRVQICELNNGDYTWIEINKNLLENKNSVLFKKNMLKTETDYYDMIIRFNENQIKKLSENEELSWTLVEVIENKADNDKFKIYAECVKFATNKDDNIIQFISEIEKLQ